MADYTRAVGSTGTMLLRDNGSAAEFWLKAGAQTWCNNKPWGYTANGGTNHSLLYSYPQGGNWHHLGSVGISGSQNVTFWIGASGTSGLDGPADLTAFFQRATIPPAPVNLRVYNIWDTTCTTQFDWGGDGGSPIDAWQITYNTNPSGGYWTLPSNGLNNLVGLTPGQVYYFWAQGHNALGWGYWGGPVGWTQLRVPDPPSAPVLSQVTQTTLVATWSGNWHGGTGITAYQLGWGLPGQGAILNRIGSPPQTVTDLLPGTTYYFYTRAQNAIGWSPWAGPTAVKTISGARVKVGVDQKEAIPYVKVNGVWRLARPWVNYTGVWKESQ